MQKAKAFERHGVRECYYIEMIPVGNGPVRIIPCFGQPVFEANGDLNDQEA